MRRYPVVVRFPLHWGEMDALGHVNNARYFTWFESARIALFERVGLASSGRPALGPILAHTRCDFLRPLTYPAEVLVGARITRLGRTSFGMEYGVALAGAADEPVARGEGVIVLVDYTTGAKVPIPDDLRSRLATLGSTADS
ncbi:MAG TPA: thioesterase family protein [Thermoanaerobaculia bacterium]|nr:thioesterase family protein [Thermoanaerobaculia bacterium]